MFGESYQSLLIPENVSFGDNSDDVEKALGEEPDSPKGEGRLELSYFPGEELTSPHYLFKVNFSFYEDGKEEFKNNTRLAYVKYDIKDRIRYDERTEDKHGDIGEEYETIKSFLSEKYGESFLNKEDGGGYEKRCFWENDDSTIGITLTLVHTTSRNHDGEINLKYSDITRLKSPWYE